MQSTLRIFKEILPQLPTHLAHAIATQTHRDTKAMARANLPGLQIINRTVIRLIFAYGTL